MKPQNFSQYAKTASLLFAAYFLSGCIIHVGGSTKSADVELEELLTLNASGIERIIIDAGAGSLVVVGEDNADEISVDADIRTTEERNYRLSLVRNGSDAKLVAIPNTNNWGSWRKSPRIDVMVKLPSSLAVDIEDSSGDLRVSNITNRLRVDDSSGNIVIDTIGGTTIVDDNSGDIKISNVEGDVTVDDGSGSIDIMSTAGNVSVEDGSGNIDITDTDGVVTIDDGSGNIYVRSALGLNIIDDGSGKTTIKDVSGRISQNSDRGGE